MQKHYFPIFILLLTPASASELDLGLGITSISYPDYLGSDHQNSLTLPYPYISYKSDTLEIDSSGLNKDIFSIDNFRIKLSFGGSIPVQGSKIREGMPDLDPSGQLGPSLLYTFYKKNGFLLEMNLPIRAVVSTDFKGIDYRGYVYEASVSMEYENEQGYHFDFSTGAVWGDSRYLNYVYGVPKSMATTTRNAYEAEAGYLGFRTSLGFAKKFDKFWLGAFLQNYNLNNSSIDGSPFLREKSALYGGFALSYLFDKSVSNQVKEWIE